VNISSESKAKWKATLDQERKQQEQISKMIRYRCALRNFFLLILCLGFWLGFGEFFTGSCTTIADYYMRNYDSKTDGVIVSATVKNGPRTTAIPRIRYEYQAEGIQHSSNKVNFLTNNGDSAYQIVKKYSTGKRVTVYYDSATPSASILEKTSLGLWRWAQLIGAIIMGLVTFFAYRKIC
jgi:Protein of unknown function (DUF3592)